jgi:dTDP-4-amino-4,6-dideoxygalactose transaminase
MSVPFFPPDLFEADREVLLDLVHRIGTAADQRFILGEHTARFEAALAGTLGAAEVVACASGTAALTLVLSALGIQAGDEVVVPAFGCAPLAATVVGLGATPVFADVDPWTMVADPHEMERLVTARTRALMPAHMFSVMADMPRLRQLATKYGLRLVEDSAVAQGGVLDGRPAGLWGDAGVFSFVQVKTFGTAGEGGAVVTADASLAAAVRMLRNHGQDGRRRFVHHRIGYNSRFDEIQAAFCLHRLPGLAGRLERRAAIAAYYTERFTPLAERGVRPPPPGRNGRCYYVYCLLAQRRDDLLRHLAARGVASHVYYRLPLPRQPAFVRYTPPGRHWPNAEQACRRSLAIPVHPHLTDAQVEHIADAVCEFATAERTP